MWLKGNKKKIYILLILLLELGQFQPVISISKNQVAAYEETSQVSAPSQVIATDEGVNFGGNSVLNSRSEAQFGDATTPSEPSTQEPTSETTPSEGGSETTNPSDTVIPGEEPSGTEGTNDSTGGNPDGENGNGEGTDNQTPVDTGTGEDNENIEGSSEGEVEVNNPLDETPKEEVVEQKPVDEYEPPIQVIMPEGGLFFDSQGRIDPLSITSVSTQGGKEGVTYCSLITRSNLEYILRVGGWRNTEKYIKAGDATQLIVDGLASQTLFEISKDELLPKITSLYENRKQTLFDIYLYRGNIEEPSYEFGHRFLVFVGSDGDFYVLDPIRGNKSLKPQKLREYMWSIGDTEKVYFGNRGYNPFSTTREILVEEEVVLQEGDVTVTIQPDTVIVQEDAGADSEFESVEDFVIQTEEPVLPQVRQELGTPVADNADMFQIGDPNAHLMFSNPVEVRIKTDFTESQPISIYVKHEGELEYTTRGITLDSSAQCIDGVSSNENYIASVNVGEIVFYTCGASQFLLTPTSGSATITLPASGSVYNTPYPVIAGTGTVEGAIVTLTLSGGAQVGTASVVGGMWSIVPYSGLSVGTHTLCIASGSTCTTIGIYDFFASRGTTDTSLTGAGLADSYVNSIMYQPDGKIVLAGAFTSFNGITKNGIVRLTNTGAVDDTFTGDFINPGEEIRSMVYQPDGKIVIGGAFSTVNGTNRANLARLTSTGSLDPLFTGLFSDQEINILLYQPDGKILVGGLFDNFNGTGQQKLVRLTSTGVIDTTFVITGVDGGIKALAQQADGKILVGGEFSTFGNVSANRLVRLTNTGALDTSFAGSFFDDTVNSIVVKPDHSILVGGSFNDFNGDGYQKIMLLDQDGNPGIFPANNFNPTDTVNTILLQPDGGIIIGGMFSSMNGVNRNNLLRLTSTGMLDDIFTGGFLASGTAVNALLLQPDSRVLVGGIFDSFNGDDNQNNITRLDVVSQSIVFPLSGSSFFNPYPTFWGTGSLDGSEVVVRYGSGGAVIGTATVVDGMWSLVPAAPIVTGTNSICVNNSTSCITVSITGHVAPGPMIDDTFTGTLANTTVKAFYQYPDGSLLIAGAFTQFNGIGRQRIVRVSSTGVVDTTFTGVFADGTINVIAVQPDGKILVGGSFSNFGGAGRPRLARLTSTGVLDTTFTGAFGNNDINTINLYPDGRILVGGAFTQFNGITKTRLARLTSTGVLDNTFTGASPSSTVNSVIVQPDGKILVAGAFATVSSIPKSRLARLTSTGVIDNTFTGSFASGTITSMVQQSDGMILVGGAFTGFNGVNRNRLARLTTTGVLDDTFTGSFADNNDIQIVLPLQDGRILVGGTFTGFNGVNRTRLALLSSTGGLEPTFTGAFANSTIISLFQQSDGKILIGGGLTTFNGIAKGFVVRLNTETSTITTPGSGSMFTTAYPYIGGTGNVEGNTVTITDGTNGPVVGTATVLDGMWSLIPNVGLSVGVHELCVNGGKSCTTITIGNFTSIGGSLDPSFSGSFGFVANSLIRSIIYQTDGKVLVAGTFTGFNGISKNGLVRLTSTGVIDDTFTGTFANNGDVYTILQQSDGMILVGGTFTGFNGVARNRLARLTSTGALDPTFTGTFANGAVYAMFVQPNGKVIIGGAFTTINGSTATRIARLTTTGGLDTSFTGSATNVQVLSIASQPDGKLIIGGFFNTYNGVTRNSLVRVTNTGALDDTFTGSFTANNYVQSVAVQPDGKILVVGTFTGFNGANRNYVARVTSTGALDDTFTGAFANGNTFSVAVQPDGKILVGGIFTSFNGVNRNRLARLTSTGATDPTFTGVFATNSYILSIVSQYDGAILVGGGFTSFNGSAKNGLARMIVESATITTPYSGGVYNTPYPLLGGTGNVNGYTVTVTLGTGGATIGTATVVEGMWTVYPTTGLSAGQNTICVNNGQSCSTITINDFKAAYGIDNTFTGSFADNSIEAVAYQPDGKILVGGSFTTVNGINRNGLARLTSTGALDDTFTGFFTTGTVNDILVQPDGKILVGGAFGLFNGIVKNELVRLTSTGVIDDTFTGTFSNNTVLSIALQPDGKVLVGGQFTTFNGGTRQRVARLTTTGALDDTFSGGTIDSIVRSVSLQPDGKILLGGNFTSVRGATRNRVARLTTTGALDTTFTGVFASNVVQTVVPQVDGNILVGGQFTTFNGISKGRLVRVTSTGATDDSFTGAFAGTNTIFQLYPQPDGKIIVGGNFTTFNGITKTRIARVTSTGALDHSFTGGGAGSTVNDIVVQPDGRVVMGGDFTTFNGISKNYLVRLDTERSIITVPGSGGTYNTQYPFLGGTGNVEGGTITITSGVGGPVIGTTTVVDGRWSYIPTSPLPVGTNEICVSNGESCTTITIIDPTTFGAGIDTTFTGTFANGRVRTIVYQPDGMILVGGDFTTFNGTNRNRLARITNTGALDPTFTGSFANNIISAVTIQPDGSVLVGGDFTTFNGANRNRLARLTSTGALDTTFTGSFANSSSVLSIFYQPDGKILVGGAFTTMNGTSRNNIARLTNVGALDTTFAGTLADATVTIILPQSDGKILLGGNFANFNSVPKSRLARITSFAALDNTFTGNYSSNGIIRSIANQEDGKVIIGGQFTTIGGVNRNYLARLTSTGVLDTAFTGVFANNPVEAVSYLSNSKILVGGQFTSFNGVNRNYVARLTSTGVLDPLFTGILANSGVYSIAVQTDSDLLLGGDFTSFNGVSTNKITRLGGYILSYITTTGGTITGNVYQNIRSGNTGTVVTAIANTGYTFSGWSDGYTGASRQDYVTDNKTLTAYFTINTYTLTYNTGSIGGVISGTTIQNVAYGNTGTIVEAVASYGYTFSGWNDGYTGATRQDFVTGNKTLTAYFTPNTYTLTYMVNTGAVISGTAIQSVTYLTTGTLVELLMNVGYTFSGWSDGYTGMSRQDFVTGNKVLTGYFTLNTYVITYTGSTGGVVSGNTNQTIGYSGTTTLVEAVASYGYTFSGWSDGYTGISRQETLVSGNANYIAYFTPNTYNLTYVAGTGGTISGTANQSIIYLTTGTLVEAVASYGYTFSGWSDGYTGTSREDFVTGNKTLTAYFTPNTYNLTYIAATGGIISGTSNQNITYLTTGTLVEAVAGYGYTFSGWNDGYTGATRQDFVTGNKTLTAYFTPNTYTLTYMVNTGAVISGTAIQSVTYLTTGTLVELLMNVGYTFSGWSDGYTGMSRQDFVTGNKVLTGYFTLNTYVITYTGSTGGIVSGNTNQTIGYSGTTTLVEAVASYGYTFSGWSDGYTGISRQETLVSGNANYIAYFTPNTYNLTYVASTGGTISGTANQSVTYLTTGTLVEAVASYGYTFSGWNDGYTGATRQDFVTGNKTLTAYFTPNTYTLTYMVNTGAVISGTAVQSVTYLTTGTLVELLMNVGYTFSGWSDGYTGMSRQDFVTGNKVLTGYFTLNTYVITYTGSTGGIVSGNTNQTVGYSGSTTLVEAVAGYGYTFSGWSDGYTGVSRQEMLVSGNANYIAYFTPNTYNLTYVASTGGSISGTANQSVTYLTTGTLVEAVASYGYTFSGWSDGYTGMSRQDFVTGNKTLTAYFTPNTYNLTYVASTGGTISGVSNQSVTYLTTGTLVEAIASYGYTFSGWSDGYTGTSREDLVTGNKTLTAYFTPNTYNLTYVASTGGTISGTANQNVTYLTTGTLVEAVASYGYTFSGWNDGYTGATRQDFVTGNKTLTAYFTPNTYNLTYVAGTGGTISGTANQTVIYLTTGTLVEAVANTGYTFSGWSDGYTGMSRQDFVTGNKTLTAYFTLNGYSLDYIAGTGGAISGQANQGVGYGNTGMLVEAVANYGYTFSGWNDGYTGVTRQDYVTGNKTLIAYFTPNTYNLTYVASTGGTISGTSNQNITYLTTGTLVEAVAGYGYTFSGWNDGYTGAMREDFVTGNKTLTAYFTPNTYNLTYVVSTGGSISGTANQSVTYLTTGTLVEAVAGYGYTFSGWNDGYTGAMREDFVTGNKTLTAYFTPNTYNLTYVAGTGGTISGTANQNVTYLTTGTLVEAVASYGYTFSGWSDGYTGITRQETLVSGNANYIAYFTPNTYNLTYVASTGGTISGTVNQSVIYLTTGTLVEAVASYGYTFSGWNDGYTGTTRQDFVTGNKTLTAYFTPNTYTLTYMVNTGAVISGTAIQSVTYLTTGTLVELLMNVGYTFSGWSDGYTGMSRQDFVTGNKVLTGYFTLNTYVITYTGSTGGVVSGNTNQTIGYSGTTTLVEAVASYGYTFSGWSDGYTGITRQETLVSGNANYIAYFTPNTYNLTYVASTGGTISGTANQSIIYLTTGTLVEAVASYGYTFSGWSDGYTGMSRQDFVTGNKTLTAYFTPNTYNLTYVASTGGTISGVSNQSVTYLTTGTLVEAVASYGYIFSGWSDGYTGTSREDLVTGNKTLTAYFTPNTYNLTYVASTGGTISGTANQSVIYLTTGTLVEAVASYGYTFSGWNDGYTGATRQDLVTGNKTLTAYFTPNTYNLTYVASTGGTISGTANQNITYLTTGMLVEAIANTGYTFSGWSDGYTGTSREDFVTGNKTLTAYFTPNTYNLTYIAATGGTISGTANQNVIYLTTGTLVEAVAGYGYTFSGWNDGYTGAIRQDLVTGNKTLTAYFTPNTYNLTYVASTGGTISGTTNQSVTYLTTGTLVEAVASYGYTFSGWNDGYTGATRQDFVTGNKTLTAYFTPNTYNLTYVASTGGTISGTSNQSVTYLTTGTLVEAVAGYGYTFSGWSDGYTGMSRQDFVTGNKTLTAYFTPNTYNLTYVASTGGMISGTANQSVIYLTTGTLVEAVASYGYTFSGWNDGYTGAIRQDFVTGNKTLTAYFTPNTYNLTYVASTGGTISGITNQNITYLTTGMLVEAIANTGYTFSGWSDGYTGVARQDFVTGNKTLTAYFTLNGYSLDYIASTGGAISGQANQGVSYGNTGTLVEAVADYGYTFSGWSDGYTGTSRQDLVTGNKTLTAYFTPNTYNLTYVAGTGGSISGTSIQSVTYLTTGTLVEAVASYGYTFSGWNDGYTGATRQDFVTGNKTLTAYFTPNTYTLTYMVNTGAVISGTAVQSVTYLTTGTLVELLMNVGYTFSGWSDGYTGMSRQDFVTGNKVLTGYFTLNTYVITYTGSTGGVVSGNTNQTIGYSGTTTLVEAVANYGYTFSGWSDGYTGISRQETLVSGNANYIAYFTPNTYNLTYVAATGGTISGTANQSVTYLTTGTLVEAVASYGYTFSGWNDGYTGATRQDFVTGNKTLTAYFTPNTYNLTYVASTGGTISGTANQSVTYITTGTLVEAIANTGYTFSGWSDGYTGVSRQDFVTGNKTLTAYFTLNGYSLDYIASTGGTISGQANQGVGYGNTGMLVEAIASYGYTFSGWSDGYTGTTREDLVTGNKTFTAYFTPNTYTLTYIAGTGGIISGTSIQSVIYLTTGTLVEAVVSYGYTFSGWSDGYTGATRQDLVTGNKTLIAYFTVNNYSLDYIAGTGGIISGQANQSVNYGNTGTLVEAVANIGYTFSGWSDGYTGAIRQDLVTGNKTLTAYFTINGYSLDYIASTGGTISGTANQGVNYGNTGTLVEAVANYGYTFSGWSDGYTGISRQDFVTGNKTLTAYFTINTYNLTYVVSTGGTISGTTNQNVTYLMTGTLVEAVASYGYTFSGWSDGYTGLSREDFITGNKTLTAYFTPNTYNLTYVAGTGGSISGTANQNITYLTTGTLVEAVASYGYTFSGWSDGYTGVSRQDFVTGNKTLTAYFTPNTYNLTYVAGTGGMISGTVNQNITYLTTGTLVEAVASYGYTFSGWSDGYTGITRQETLVSGNANYIAYFTPNTYNLTYVAATGGTISGTANQSVTYLTTGTLVEAVASYGYTFSGWNDGYTGATRQDFVTGNKTLTAYFTPNTYNLTYVVSTGGTISGTANQSVTYLTTGTLVEAVASYGYTFSGWSDGYTGLSRQDFVTGNKTLTAYFTLNTYNLTYVASTGGSISGTTNQNVTYLTTGTLVEAVASYGYTFSGWNDGYTGVTRQDFVTGNKTLTAYFTPNTYNLTYVAATGGTISGTTNQSVTYLTTGTLVEAVSSYGYTFSGWSDGYTGVTRQDFVTGNKTLTAYFIPNTYNLTYVAGTGGSISGTSIQSVTYLTTGTLVEVVASYGYTFSGWSDGYTGAIRQDFVTGNKTLTAYFTPNTYNLTYVASTGGTISGTANQSVTYLTTGTLVEAVANYGYTFSGWSDGYTGATRQDFVTGNKTLTAYFTINTYNLTYIASTGGVISGTTNQNVTYLTTGTLVEAIANTGYTFSGWSDGYTGATREDFVTGNKILTAYFTINTYTLSYTGSTGGIVSGTLVQLITHGSTGTAVQAVANTGYHFSGWSDGYTGATRSDYMTGNKTLTAYFTINTYTLTYTGSTGGTISGTVVQLIAHGSTGSMVQAIANIGYTFSGWSDGYTGSTRSDYMTGNKTLTAYFTMTLTYTGSTGGTISGASIQIFTDPMTGSAVQAIANTGYHFSGWSDGYTGSTRSDYVTGNKTLTAYFTINTYTLTYTGNTGGVISGTLVQFVTHGSTGTPVQVTPNIGYHFSGWSDGYTGTTRSDYMTGNKTVTAIFTINTYTLTYTGSTGGTVSGTMIQSVNYGNTGSLVEVITNYGYTFSGWSDGYTGLTRRDYITGDKSLIAQFIINTYTLTYTGDTGGVISGNAVQLVDYSSTGSLIEIIVNSGYTFSGWTDGYTGMTRQDFVTGNKTLTVEYILTILLPVVTLNGPSSMTIYQGSGYSEQGAQWEDYTDGSGQILVPTSGSVNSSVIGTYILQYSYTNSNLYTRGVTRTVHVIAAPVSMPPVQGGGGGGGGGRGTGNISQDPKPSNTGNHLTGIDTIVNTGVFTSTGFIPNIIVNQQIATLYTGETINIVVQTNPSLSTDEACYTPEKLVQITLGHKPVDKKLLLYQSLIKSYNLTKFKNTDLYRPDNFLTRQEAAKMFVEFAVKVLCRERTKVYDNQYKDIDKVDGTLKPFIIDAYEYGIMQGSKGSFRPKDIITNQEFVAILIRLLTNRNLDLQGQGNNRDVKYKELYKEYGLDAVIGVNKSVDRFGVSKAFYNIYYNPNYVWSDKGYIIPLD